MPKNMLSQKPSVIISLCLLATSSPTLSACDYRDSARQELPQGILKRGTILQLIKPLCVASVYYFCPCLIICYPPLSPLPSSSSKSGHSEVEKNGGSSTGEPVAPESDRHVYKSVLEGGDIPLQGLRALNKRHGSSSSSKGRGPDAFLLHLTGSVKMAGVYLFMDVGARF